MDVERQIGRLLERAQGDPDVLAVLHFGSRARGDERPTSDVDVCLVLTSGSRAPLDLARKQLDYASDGDLDVKIFERLPLPIRSRVLREGRILLVRDEDLLYEIASRTARAFEMFKPYYRMYLEEVARGRP